MKKFLLLTALVISGAAPLRALNITLPTSPVHTNQTYSVSATDSAVGATQGGAPATNITITILKNGDAQHPVVTMGGGVSVSLTVSGTTSDLVDHTDKFDATSVITYATNPVSTSSQTVTVYLYVDGAGPTTPAPTVAAVTATSVSLTWAASTDTIGAVSNGVGSYQIKCRDSSQSTIISTNNTATNSGSATGLTAKTSYQIRVRAVDTLGNWSAWSPYLGVTSGLESARR